ncbi:hypothetical protein B0H17DRAFT_1036050 [Mycena rosella]|uniref:Peroxin domain-containing protein n=1 Tax=Mycena rosella TaxID=1033263 RepID=A0AAD7GVJ2_MYCRO|nr:hypothetical protein B0H17DRAFT_1036050 [Mycena rosella]
MIDMRSDSGEVQHDGFEFNFMFRTHKWHPEAGAISWVRRRRWIRLMMRPAKRDPKKLKPDDSSLTPNATPITPAASTKNRYSMASSFPPSVLDSHAEGDSFFEVDVDEVWLSDDVDANWDRCRAAIRRAGRDGRILELWRRWFGDEPDPQDAKRMRKQWTEDDDVVPSDSLAALPQAAQHTSLPITNILPALRRHGDAILHSFIYPESRACFVQILERAGVLRELNADFGAGATSGNVEFWSYLSEVRGEEIIPQDSTVKRV